MVSACVMQVSYIWDVGVYCIVVLHVGVRVYRVGVASHAYNYANTTPPHTQVQSQNLTLYYSLSFVYVVRGYACAVLQINIQATPQGANVELILGVSSVSILNSFHTRNSFVYVTHSHT